MIGQDESVEEIVPTGLTTGDWVQAGVLVLAALLLALLVHRAVVRLVAHGVGARVGVARLVGRLLGMVVFLGGVIYALNTLGVRVGPLLGALGIAGVAVAFALQDILENFMAGIILQARNPVRLGDQVESGDWQGTVEDINFRDVVLRTVDGTRVVLPNSSVLRDAIQNLTAFEHRRTTVTVGVAYGTDLNRAADVIRAAVDDLDDVAAGPPTEVLVEELGESSVDFAVRFWHRPDINTMWHTRDQVLRAAYTALDDAGMTIPFPQRTVSFLDPGVQQARPGSTGALPSGDVAAGPGPAPGAPGGGGADGGHSDDLDAAGRKGSGRDAGPEGSGGDAGPEGSGRT